MRNRNWSDEVRKFLRLKRDHASFPCGSKSTAQQTAWRLRRRHDAILEIHARGDRVVFQKRR